MYTARWNPLLDCQLIALSFAVNIFEVARPATIAPLKLGTLRVSWKTVRSAASDSSSNK